MWEYTKYNKGSFVIQDTILSSDNVKRQGVTQYRVSQKSTMHIAKTANQTWH